MHRFYSSSKDISGDKITIADKACLHHIKDVLWLKEGDGVVVFDQSGKEYSCSIEELRKDSVLLKVKEMIVTPDRNMARITVACAIPKNSKMDEIVDKLTQLGVEKIIPLETKRVVVRLSAEKKKLRRKRWEKIALGSAEQSQRNSLPVIEPVAGLKEVLAQSTGYGLKLLPTLEGERKFLSDVFSAAKPGKILILIGPEGDFTREEIREAVKSGFIPVTLGELVLRVDTAAIAAVSFIRLYENS